MPLNIRSENVNELAKRLAQAKHMSKTDAGRLALHNELRRSEDKAPLRDRIMLIQERVLARPATGREANKAFFHGLYGED